MIADVAVLCAARQSAYHDIPGVDVFDSVRDARTFQGGMPVICHPPCRSWSKLVRHQAHSLGHEQELGRWCLDQARRWGGVVEQPLSSVLLHGLGLSVRVTMVYGAWFGFRTPKPTALAWFGIKPGEAPFSLFHPTGRRGWQVMSAYQRSETTPAMAQWLVDAVRGGVAI